MQKSLTSSKIDPIQDTTRKIPHAFVILFGLSILAVVITYIIPSGSYERTTNAQGRTVLVDGTYQFTDQNPVGIFDFFNSFFQGMSSGSSIIFFLIIVGGAFGVLRQTQALEGVINHALKKLSGKEIYIIPIMMTFFALCSGTYGMIEGSIVFIFILLPLASRLGYDAIVAAAIPLVGTSIGYTGSFINPFNVGVAQAIADVPLFSGMLFRVACWFLFLCVAIGYVVYYAKKVQRYPESSYVFGYGINSDYGSSSQEVVSLTFQHILILLSFAISLAFIIVGVSSWGWYLKEMSGVFLILGVVTGILAKMTPNNIAGAFSRGCKDMMDGALAVGLAYTIVVIIQNGGIIDTIIFYLSNAVSGFSSTVGALGMYGIQSLMNFIVTSGSGQAALTMPIMSPLADILSVNRQVAVLAFQFGDGISNSFTPTAGWLMAGLTIAGIPWTRWIRFMLPLIAMLYILGALLVSVANIFIWPA